VDWKAHRDCSRQIRSVVNKLWPYKEILANIIRRKESESKNEEVKKVLRDAYDKAYKALKVFHKSCDEAINKARAGGSA
jgi:Mg2+ and Co2+ transporter CorA